MRKTKKVSDYLPLKKTVIHIRIEQELKKELEQAAKHEKTSLTKLMTAIIKHYLKM